MRKIVYLVHTSVDGFIEGPEGEFDWPLMGPELSSYVQEFDERTDLFLYGRKRTALELSDARTVDGKVVVMRYALR
ncbi:hypothetical protein OG552_20220 [Streptomyces sp. NBC_01476]|uniref:hypothetical protein n=1 Tax=Streptomyces sp. NBC_01476 TaxID=2903881 RepID=UPI002E348256|nr:hypothetical protein [Streptomyces sp. NBC_01476]